MNEWTSCAHSWVLCPLQTPTSHLDPQAGSSPSGGHPSGSPPLEQICGGPGPLVFVFIKRGRWCPFEPGRCADPARSPAALHAQPLPPPWLTPPSKSAAYGRVRTPIRGDETERGGGAEGTQPPPSSRGDGAGGAPCPGAGGTGGRGSGRGIPGGDRGEDRRREESWASPGLAAPLTHSVKGCMVEGGTDGSSQRGAGLEGSRARRFPREPAARSWRAGSREKRRALSRWRREPRGLLARTVTGKKRLRKDAFHTGRGKRHNTGATWRGGRDSERAGMRSDAVAEGQRTGGDVTADVSRTAQSVGSRQGPAEAGLAAGVARGPGSRAREACHGVAGRGGRL